MAWLAKHGPTYWIFDRDSTTRKVRRVIKAYTDKKASESKLAKFEQARARGQEGLVDLFASHRQRLLADHVKEYLEDVKTRGASKPYLQSEGSRLRCLLKETGWKTLADITADSFRLWRSRAVTVMVKEGARAGETRRGPVALNRYLEAARTFCAWCAGRRMAKNPLEGLEKVDVPSDIRRDRRAFSDADAEARVRSASTEHAEVYQFALGTGLRRSELAKADLGRRQAVICPALSGTPGEGDESPPCRLHPPPLDAGGHAGGPQETNRKRFGR